MVVFDWLTMMIVPIICIKINSLTVLLCCLNFHVYGWGSIDWETISSLLDLIHSSREFLVMTFFILHMKFF